MAKLYFELCTFSTDVLISSIFNSATCNLAPCLFVSTTIPNDTVPSCKLLLLSSLNLVFTRSTRSLLHLSCALCIVLDRRPQIFKLVDLLSNLHLSPSHSHKYFLYCVCWPSFVFIGSVEVDVVNTWPVQTNCNVCILNSDLWRQTHGRF